MNRAVLVLPIALTLCACASVTEVTPMGKDTYMVGADDTSGVKSHTEVAQLAIKRANEYCAARHQVMSPQNVKNTGVQWWSAEETQFIFECLNESDPAYRRPQLESAPSAILQVR